MKPYDLMVLGAGASGLWAAMVAARRGKRVCVVDHGKKPGRKVLVAGGGKCNFTNRDMEPHHFVCENPHFVKSAIARFTPWEIIGFLDARGISWEERELGRLFCKKSAADIVSALKEACRRSGVSFYLGQRITRLEKKENFHLTLSQETVEAQNCLVALGGPAWPQVGATDFGHRIAKQFGHAIVPARPALVPFTLKKKSSFKELAGIALPARLTAGGKSVTENLLFTHTGLSGPAALQGSCNWKKGEAIAIDFLPQAPIDTLFDASGGKPMVKTVIGKHLPERLTRAILPSKLASKQVAQLTRDQYDTLKKRIHNHLITPSGTLGMKKAEVTGGGVCTREISSKTMESKKTKGLYFAGEVLDVTGQLGGYNLHWAWASGQAVGESV
ncbi:MAG: NAD(P)/FAD-dependent oxidoreductase [Desulfobacterales bacterium]|nr:NAD(P)/FAD-dependent oxidoreductase [Desulfobacterales bacterium]